MSTTKVPDGKYRGFNPDAVSDFVRTWPSNTTRRAPIWCSVDLRDGNQALQTPMSVTQKLEFFKLLVKIGFKEIEVGFPASNPTEFSFIRRLIEEGHIPDDVTIQVLVQAVESQIKTTVESLVGAKRAIIHMYNSTSPAQRRIVFEKSKDQVIDLAVQGTKWVKQYSAKLTQAGTEVVYQYSPESFSATEVGFALQVCEQVVAEWGATPSQKMILNLPDTVEVAGPHVYADMIECFCEHFTQRESVIISLHTHNDRGTGVAATELGLLAGGERVEGTLFGNGERTGNLDIIIVALNLYTHGVDPGLDFSGMAGIQEVYTRCTGMTVPARQPYSGELVFTAFSGSHQDAIKKGLDNRKRALALTTGAMDVPWDVPYLTIDPADLGREYGAVVIRVNNQSGKGGIAYLLETKCGFVLPKDLQREFGMVASPAIDKLGREVQSAELEAMFLGEYISRTVPYDLLQFDSNDTDRGCQVNAEITAAIGGEKCRIFGVGNGPVAAFVDALGAAGIAKVEVLQYAEHALGSGASATAIAYVCIKLPSSSICWGAGTDTSIERASIKAILSALNREFRRKL